MKNKYAISTLIAAFACLSGVSDAVEIYGGNGIGYSNNSINPSTGAATFGPWVANMVFTKQDLKKSATGEIHTGQDITPAVQADAAAKGGVTAYVQPTKSMAWCDPVSNPDIAGNTDINQCYGWAMHSKWVVVDLNALQKAASNVWVTITAERYDDGDADTTDDDLIPALTVFRGVQNAGVHLHWFPNKFQKEQFWAWKLTPFYTGAKKTDKTGGWATAYGPGAQDTATVTGKFALKPGNQNYLSVAIGGDARHASATEKHNVNFKLSVQVSRKKPATGGGDNGGSNGLIDKCGCEIGVTQWHASMNHCMQIALCAPIAGTADQCKTPEMCEKDGGR